MFMRPKICARHDRWSTFINIMHMPNKSGSISRLRSDIKVRSRQGTMGFIQIMGPISDKSFRMMGFWSYNAITKNDGRKPGPSLTDKLGIRSLDGTRAHLLDGPDQAELKSRRKIRFSFYKTIRAHNKMVRIWTNYQCHVQCSYSRRTLRDGIIGEKQYTPKIGTTQLHDGHSVTCYSATIFVPTMQQKMMIKTTPLLCLCGIKHSLSS